MNAHAGYSESFRVRFSAALTTATIAMALVFGTAIYAPPARAAVGDADDQAMVDCMLPGQIQRLNNNVMIMGARHPIRTTRADCHVRGGEYHDADRTTDAARAVDADRPAAVRHTTKARRKAHRNAKTVKPTSTTSK